MTLSAARIPSVEFDEVVRVRAERGLGVGRDLRLRDHRAALHHGADPPKRRREVLDDLIARLERDEVDERLLVLARLGDLASDVGPDHDAHAQRQARQGDLERLPQEVPQRT